MEGGGMKDACQVTVGFLCVVCLSRFSLSVCRREFQAELRIRPSGLILFKSRRKSEIKSTEPIIVILAKHWLWLPDDGFLVNRNMLEQPL